MTKTDYRVQFNSWEEFLAEAEKEPLSPYPSSRRRSDSNWAGGSFSQALEMARKGWPEGYDKAKEALENLEAHLPTKTVRHEFTMSPVGPGALDMQRYMMGHPEPWGVWQETEDTMNSGNGKIITVVFNGAISAGVSQEAMIQKGVTIAAMIDWLETHGNRVELIYKSVGTSDRYRRNTTAGNKIEYRILLKSPGEPLDLNRIIYAIAHPSTWRRLIFSVMEQAPEDVRRRYGIGEKGSNYYTIPCNEDEDFDCIHVPSSAIAEFENEVNKIKWIVGKMKEQGIELETRD